MRLFGNRKKNKKNRLSISYAFSLWIPMLLLLISAPAAPGIDCEPSTYDALGPYYKPGAPVRSKVGTGYVLSGTVLSSSGCDAIPGAKIEFWLAGPQGRYSDEYRATVFSDTEGQYRFESDYPGIYPGRPPHIHIRISARGYETHVTQHYPAKNSTADTLRLVIVPLR
jgi:protocatechuate 3,4-dioxygenase beta subunit